MPERGIHCYLFYVCHIVLKLKKLLLMSVLLEGKILV